MVAVKVDSKNAQCKCPTCKRWTLQQSLNRSYFNCLYCGRTFKLQEVNSHRPVRVIL